MPDSHAVTPNQLFTSAPPLKGSNLSCGLTGTSALPGSCCDHTERILQRHFSGRGSRSLVEESDLQGDLQTGRWRTGWVQASALGVRNDATVVAVTMWTYLVSKTTENDKLQSAPGLIGFKHLEWFKMRTALKRQKVKINSTGWE